MDSYRSYRDFLGDIRIWGDKTCGQEQGFNPGKNWDIMIAKAAQGADLGVFSPFLYISLSARLERESMMLLAAAFYTEMRGERLSYPVWELFFSGEGNGFPGAEVFCQPPSLLFEAQETAGTAGPGLHIAPRLYLFLCGTILDPRPLPGMRWYSLPGEPLPALGAAACRHDRIMRCLQEVPGRKLVYLQGEKGCGRKLNYASLAAQRHMGLAVIPYETLESEKQLREIRLECLTGRFMFAIELNGKEGNLHLLLHWLRDEETVFLLGGQKEIPFDVLMGRQYLPFSIPTEEVLMDKELFASLTLTYPWDSETLRKDFLSRYNFLPGRVREILELAASYSKSSGDGCITEGHLRRAVLRASSHSLDKYARKVKGVYQMEDLILPDMPKQKLSHIIHRIRNRKLVYEEWGFKEKSPYGNGVSMVFAGPPGTGKTMAAQVMAAELGMELYLVELPAIVDKYIGETEKKLSRIFGEAEKSMAILFFDEADVLFSKRTEIKESNDKYSNMEIAFLLQKMEEYDGISILATNYLQNFDSAFRRRISDIIDFPLPDASLRLKMWQSMLPPRLPLSDEIDYSFLARQFEVSGSVIKNSLIYASFLAAEAGEPLLTMQRILKGLSHELEKSGKKLSRGEYGEYGHLF